MHTGFEVKRSLGYLNAIASIVLVSAAQLLIKTAAIHMDSTYLLGDPSRVLDLVLLPSFSLPFLLAGISYLFSIFFWIKTLSHLPLSLAYPLISLSYPLVYLSAAFVHFLGESLSLQRSIGVALIVAGVIFTTLEKEG